MQWGLRGRITEIHSAVCLALQVGAYLWLRCCAAEGQTRSDLTRHGAPQHPPRQHPAGAEGQTPPTPLNSALTAPTADSMSENLHCRGACWFSLIKLRGLDKYVTPYPSCPRGTYRHPIFQTCASACTETGVIRGQYQRYH